MKTIKGSRTKRPKQADLISTELPCVHAARMCYSACPFFDEEPTDRGTKAVLSCTGTPVTVVIEHDGRPDAPSAELPVQPEPPGHKAH